MAGIVTYQGQKLSKRKLVKVGIRLKVLKVKQKIGKFFYMKMLPSMTSKVIPHFLKNLRVDNVSFHRIFYLNRLILECAGKNLAKIHESHSHTISWWDVEESRFSDSDVLTPPPVETK